MESDILVPFTYTVYNDFSTEENTHRLEEAARQWNFVWSTYQTWPTTPLPTIYWCYKQHKRSHRSRCRITDCGIGCYCQKNTLQSLYNGALQQNNAELQQLWQPMKRRNQLPLPTRQGTENQVYPEKSIAASAVHYSPRTAESIWLQTLDPSKNWYDVTISHESLKRGFQNYLFTTLPVWHRPHSSRPWKQLKYKNPLKYYWLKYTKGLDKI